MTEIAAEHENPKGANIVMMGAMAAQLRSVHRGRSGAPDQRVLREEGQDQPEKQPLLPRRHADPLNRRTPRGFAHEISTRGAAGSAPGKSRSGGVNFLNVLDVIIILAYFVGMIVLGLIANKKQTGVDDYYLGGRSMGALKIGCALDGRLGSAVRPSRYTQTVIPWVSPASGMWVRSPSAACSSRSSWPSPSSA